EQNLKRMYNAVFLPLLSSLYGVKKIYYIPCGGLTQLNFDLLKNNNGIELGKLYVMSRQTFPHKLVKNQPIYKKNIKNVVIFGGITYDSSYVSHTQKPTLTPMFRNTDFNDLDNTKYEIEQIASIFNNKKIQNHIFSGANATEDSFKKNSIQPIDIIHIATHGFCLDTDADLTKNKKYTNQTNPRTNREAAMLFSGLAFAGANKTWKGTFDGQGYENGILTAYEISQLDLSKVKFVVLSACETAKGWIYDFDGVFGLQRAFKQAGAGSILMSLWKVDDQATALFMEHFYKFLLQSGDRHEALKLAQDEVKKQYPDPYYWAAWVMLD
ncbi:MAG: CHAT domain-containing protein, partial [Bacteroidales bacterium]|nr:CHAT domain-containing protein [Bacteroidales bacterium]